MRTFIPILASLASATLAQDLGSWSVDYQSESTTGAFTRDVVARYSGQDHDVTCHYADIRQYHVDTCDDSTFSYAISYTSGNVITIKQTVSLNGTSTTIQGSGPIDIQCGYGAGGACKASTTVEATTIVS